ncbi:hypothetical protein HXY33_01675 [Candidatus Bathyarchaeota archaeon]|nr:hypothetical protein [Candidatus Bathyarchaeota archaeon]
MAFLVVLVSVLAFTPMMSAYAEVQVQVYIAFKGYALGRCLLAEITPAFQVVWYGLGLGSLALNGYAEARVYGEFDMPWFEMYGWSYATTPEGYVGAVGFLAARWFENNKLHQLSVAIYSRPTTLADLQPETDKFIIGWDEGSALSCRGVYKIGSHSQYVSGAIALWGTGIETDYVMANLWFEDYFFHIRWYNETVSLSDTLIIPAAAIFVRDVKLL